MRRFVDFALFLLVAMLATGCSQAEPALWLLKGPHSSVYVLGTVHVLKQDEPWRTPKIDVAIAKSGMLWLEIAEVDADPAVAQPLVLRLGVDQEHPLSTKLTKDQVARLDAAAKSAGLPGEAAMEPLRPWLAAISLSVAPMMKAGFDPKSGVERVLKSEFVKAGKPVKGFETMEQQLHFFADMAEKEQVTYLNSTVDNFDEAPGMFAKLVAAWYAGSDKDIDRIFSGEFRDKYPKLYKTLVVKRNESFVKQIGHLLQGNGSCFVAIGAGHLVGSDGVLAMLEKMGYTAERE